MLASIFHVSGVAISDCCLEEIDHPPAQSEFSCQVADSHLFGKLTRYMYLLQSRQARWRRQRAAAGWPCARWHRYVARWALGPPAGRTACTPAPSSGPPADSTPSRSPSSCRCDSTVNVSHNQSASAAIWVRPWAGFSLLERPVRSLTRASKTGLHAYEQLQGR